MSKCEKCKHHNSEDFFVCDGCIHETSLKDRYEPLTNADRIRAMSDEELAKFLSKPCECTVDPTTDGYRECGNNLCIRYLLEWLKQSAEVDNGQA